MKRFHKILFCMAALVAAVFCVPQVHAAIPELTNITGTIVSAGGSYAFIQALGVDRHREIYKSLRDKYGVDAVISPSYLRVEQSITNVLSAYKFNVKTDSGTTVIEQKLDRNDVFVATDLAIYLLCQTDAKLGLDPLQTYPNETAFTANAGFVPADLEGFYNGKFYFKNGPKVEIEAMSMQSFRMAPATQQSAAGNKSKMSVYEAAVPLGTLLYMQGTQNFDIQVQFNPWAAFTGAHTLAGRTNKLVFHPYGYLIKDAAEENKK